MLYAVRLSTGQYNSISALPTIDEYFSLSDGFELREQRGSIFVHQVRDPCPRPAL